MQALNYISIYLVSLLKDLEYTSCKPLCISMTWIERHLDSSNLELLLKSTKNEWRERRHYGFQHFDKVELNEFFSIMSCITMARYSIPPITPLRSVATHFPKWITLLIYIEKSAKPLNTQCEKNNQVNYANRKDTEIFVCFLNYVVEYIHRTP